VKLHEGLGEAFGGLLRLSVQNPAVRTPLVPQEAYSKWLDSV
jgi:hypothetical protein